LRFGQNQLVAPAAFGAQAAAFSGGTGGLFCFADGVLNVRVNHLAVSIAALLMGGLAAFLARSWLQGHSRDASPADLLATIVVAAKPLAFGVAVTDDAIIEIPWVANARPDGTFATKQDVLKDGRRVVLSSLAVNEPLLSSKITAPGQPGSLSTLLQEGNRAVAVRVDDVRGVAGFVLPGDYVDVVRIQAEAGPPGRRENYSEILLQHVKVLAVDQLASERNDQPTVAKAVTLEATPEQAQKILLATNVGKLSLILRQSQDAQPEPMRRITERDLSPRGAKPVEEVRAAPPPPPPPPPVVIPARKPDTAMIAIVRGLKREEYAVRRYGGAGIPAGQPTNSSGTGPSAARPATSSSGPIGTTQP
jgi:pilus assembly protein CpaB